jgi:hypothetical protein
MIKKYWTLYTYTQFCTDPIFNYVSYFLARKFLFLKMSSHATSQMRYCQYVQGINNPAEGVKKTVLLYITEVVEITPCEMRYR